MPTGLASRCLLSLIADFVVSQLQLRSASMQGFHFYELQIDSRSKEVFFYIYPAKNLQYILPNNTTYKILYATTKTIPFGTKNNVYQMAT